MPDERPVVGGTVAGGHIMWTAEVRACVVGAMGGCKLRTERVGWVPMTSVNGLFRYPDFTPDSYSNCHQVKSTLQRRVMVVIVNSLQ